MAESMLKKVRARKPRQPEGNPKEKQAWKNFIAMAEALRTEDGNMPSMVLSELDRLCAKGNPIAQRFKERLSIANFQPRKADEPPLPPPEKRRIEGVKWGSPKKRDHKER